MNPVIMLEHDPDQFASTPRAIPNAMIVLVNLDWGRLFALHEDHAEEIHRLENALDGEEFLRHTPRGPLAPTGQQSESRCDEQTALFFGTLVTELVQARRESAFDGWVLGGPQPARQGLLSECTTGLRDALHGEFDFTIHANSLDVLKAAGAILTGVQTRR